MDNMQKQRLQELDRSGFEITKGEPDIRGWDVRNASGQKIGEVEELIIDAQQKKVRYMVVELDDDEVELEDDKKVLIPIGLAELDKDDDDVFLPSVTAEQLKGLPAYDRDNLDDEAERKICHALGRTSGNTTAQPLLSTPPSATTATQSNDTTSNADNAERADSRSGDTPQQKSNFATDATGQQQPALGTADYYGMFYQHTFFSDESLYRRRMQETRDESEQRQESDYERGLRLWEMRSEGGLLQGETQSNAGREHEVSDERRREMIQDRRKAYEERRGKKGTIIQRIQDEGLQDAAH